MTVDKFSSSDAACPTSHIASSDKLESLTREVQMLEARLELVKAEINILRREREGLVKWDGVLRNNSSLAKLKAPDVIIHFLKQFDAPISLKSLRNKILMEGYPLEKFGKNSVYFYVAIDRLKNRNKIEKEGDEVRLMG